MDSRGAWLRVPVCLLINKVTVIRFAKVTVTYYLP